MRTFRRCYSAEQRRRDPGKWLVHSLSSERQLSTCGCPEVEVDRLPEAGHPGLDHPNLAHDSHRPSVPAAIDKFAGCLANCQAPPTDLPRSNQIPFGKGRSSQSEILNAQVRDLRRLCALANRRPSGTQRLLHPGTQPVDRRRSDLATDHPTVAHDQQRYPRRGGYRNALRLRPGLSLAWCVHGAATASSARQTSQWRASPPGRVRPVPRTGASRGERFAVDLVHPVWPSQAC